MLVNGSMCRIELSKGKYALVDCDMYNYLNQWKWYFRESRKGSGYAVRSRDKVRMHRLINKTPDGLFTDHINGNKLDNRKLNLRSCTVSENNRNRSIRKDNKSGYKGVSWNSQNKKWQVQLSINGKTKRVGMYKDVHEAGKRYNEVAKDIYGEFASLNLLTIQK